MAEPISIQQLKDASLDVKSLEEVVNGDENVVVTTRLGETYPSVKGSIKKVFENGGLPAVPFATKALMTASDLVDGDYAMVTDDTTNNGLYVKTAGSWVKSSYDPLGQAINYIDSSQTIEDKHAVSEFVNNGYLEHANGVFRSDANYYTTDFIPAIPSVEYSYSILSTASTGGAFYDADKNYISGFGASSTGTLRKTTSPANAYYFRVSSAKTLTNPYITAFGQYNISKINKLIASYPFKENGLLYNVKPVVFSITAEYVNYIDGQISNKLATTYARTGYVAIEPNVSYEVLAKASGNAGCGWYDKDKVFISGFQPFTKTTVVSPANARYLMLTTLVAEASKSYLKTTDERFNIDKLMSAVNAHFKLSNTDDRSLDNLAARLDIDVAKNKTTLLTVEQILKNPLAFDTIVNSKANLNTVNPSGTSDRAYPIGRRVYDHSLRQEVIADGMFWRMPDGTVASLAPRVYVFPDWDETRKALPTYAKAYKKIYDVAITGATGWTKTTVNSPNTVISVSEKYGDKRLLIEHNEGLPDTYVYLNNGSAANLNRYIILDCYFNSLDLYTLNIGLFSSDGTLLFERTIRKDYMGTRPREFHIDEHAKLEIDTQSLTPAFSGASLSNVAHFGFKVGRRAGKNAKVYIGNIETVSFKPMITLRFDDQRKTAFDNGMPVLQQYGFKGIMAVITGADDLANDPDYNYVYPAMTKADLITMRDAGWDLVAHTHTHPVGSEKSDDFMRQDYKKCREYLRAELGVSDLASSVLISPQNKRDERLAMIQREFFDAQINHISSTANSHMLRQPEGTWQTGSLWSSMSAVDGDNAQSSSALTNSLIAAAQKMIDDQRWGVVMMHEVPLVTPDGSAWKLTKQVLQDFCAWLDAHKSEIEVVTITDVVKKIRPV